MKSIILSALMLWGLNSFACPDHAKDKKHAKAHNCSEHDHAKEDMHKGHDCSEHAKKDQHHKSSPLQAKLGTAPQGKATHSISEIMTAKDKLAGQFVRVTGTVSDVCPKMGCWVELEDTKTKTKIKVKVKDGEIVFPTTVKGKNVMVEGRLEAKSLNKKRAIMYYQHLADEKGEKFDPSSVKGPITLYQIKGTGAKIVE